MKRAWTKREEQRLRRLYAQKPLAELAALFGRTPLAVKSRARILHLDKGTRRPWSGWEDRLLRQLFPHLQTSQVARIIGRRDHQVWARAKCHPDVGGDSERFQEIVRAREDAHREVEHGA